MADSRADIIHSHLHRAFINNSYSDKSTHETLNNAVKSSYQFLYDEQKSLVGYEEHYIRITRSVENLRDPYKLYFNKSYKPCININRNEIDITNVRDFRKSEFYGKEISFDDIVNHPEIFNRIPIITIDNRTIWGYKLVFNDKYVTIILPLAAKTIFEHDRLEAVNTPDHDKRVYNEHEIFIQLVNNIFYQQITVNPQKLSPSFVRIGAIRNAILNIPFDLLISINLPPKLQRLYESDGEDVTERVFDNIIHYFDNGEIETSWDLYCELDSIEGKDDFLEDMDFYSKYIKERYTKFKSMISFINVNKKRHEGILFAAFHFNENTATVISECYISSSANDKYRVTLNRSLYDELMYKQPSVTISFIFIEDIYRHNAALHYIHRRNSENELEMPLLVPMKNNTYEPYNSPIPIENCMVMRNTVDGREMVSPNRLKLYYPNIYQITDYDLHVSTLMTEGSTEKTVVADDYSGYNPNRHMKISDAFQYLQFINIGDKVYVKTDDDRNGDNRYDFYYVYKKATNLKYTPVTNFFFEYVDTNYGTSSDKFEDKLNSIYFDSTDEFNDDLILSILTYQAYIYKYGDIDFIHTYKKNNFLADKLESRVYEDKVLKNWVKYEPEVLRDYVMRQKNKGTSFYIYTKTIGDLSDRIRNDISMEAVTKTTNIEGTLPVTFNKPCYVFSIVNTEPADVKHQLRIFVDNLFVSDDVYTLRDKYIEYIYIPTTYITNDSFIEVELISELFFEDRTTFESMDDVRSYSISSPNPSVLPNRTDFVIYDDADVKLPKRYDSEFFDVSVANEYGSFKTTYMPDNPMLKFALLNTFNIKPKDDGILNKPVVLRFSKMTEGIRYIVPNDDEVYLEFVDNRFAYHKDFLRVFINGRLVPRQNYMFYPMYHYPRIRFIEEENESDPSKSFVINKGDVIYMEISPYRYTQVYYKEDISPADEYFGILDLKAILNKPVDIRYYDIYINGKKLSINNCIQLDPWSLKLVNITSKYNLLIFEKERDYEYYSVDFTSEINYPTIGEFIQKHSGNTSIIRGFFDQFIDKHGPVIKDENGEIHKITINDNTNTEPKEYYPDPKHHFLYFVFESFYFDEVIGKGFVNPDIMQVSFMFMKEYFSDIYDVYVSTALASSKSDEPNAKERRKDYIESLALDPDIYYNHEPGTPLSEKDIVYSIGHNDDNISQSILDEEIEIKTEKRIDTYVPEDIINPIWEEDE